MRPITHAAGILFLAVTACSNQVAPLIGNNSGSSGSTSGGSTSTGGTTSSGTGTTTGTAHFPCDLGDGGLFGEPITVLTGLKYAAPWHPIDVGDLNGDGNLDVVIAETGSGDVAVLFGKGDGTFRMAVHTRVPAATHAGYNDLGPMDIHIASMGSPPGPAVVMWNSAIASIVVESVQPTGKLNPVAVLDGGQRWDWGHTQVADFNNDGIADCAGTYGGPYAGGVTIFLGQDTGGYAMAASSPINATCYWDCAQDFNEDGILDLLAWSTEPPADLSVFLGLGNGSFSDTALSTAFTGSPTQDVWLTGDLNEDGHLDVLIYSSVDGSYSVLLGRGDGTFTAGPAPTFTSGWPNALRDLNGDGHLDYVGNTSDGVLVVLGNGDGTFQPQATRYVSGPPARIVVGDVNNDGRPDLIVSDWTNSNVTLFLNNCR